MSSPYTIYLSSARFESSDDAAEQARVELHTLLSAQARSLRLDSDLDEEDLADVQRFFELRPSLCVELRPRGPGGDGRTFRSLLDWARIEPGAAFVLLLDFEELARFEAGVLRPAANEREFFEREVLFGYEGEVSWLPNV